MLREAAFISSIIGTTSNKSDARLGNKRDDYVSEFWSSGHSYQYGKPRQNKMQFATPYLLAVTIKLEENTKN